MHRLLRAAGARSGLVLVRGLGVGHLARAGGRGAAPKRAAPKRAAPTERCMDSNQMVSVSSAVLF